jgi:3-keto-5-aminohexanoate cleavage enzyme
MQRQHVKPELELYDMSMIDEAAYFIDQNLIGPPWVMNFVLGTPSQGGLPGTPENLMEMYRRVKERFGVGPDGAQINVTSCGPTQLPISTMAMAMGLNVRVGMEDNVWYGPGQPVRDNAQLVQRAVRIARELGLEPATPQEARKLLGITVAHDGIPAAAGTVDAS